MPKILVGRKQFSSVMSHHRYIPLIRFSSRLVTNICVSLAAEFRGPPLRICSSGQRRWNPCLLPVKAIPWSVHSVRGAPVCALAKSVQSISSYESQNQNNGAKCTMVHGKPANLPNHSTCLHFAPHLLNHGESDCTDFASAQTGAPRTAWPDQGVV